MAERQTSLLDWVRARRAPRGAVSRAGVDGVDDGALRRLHAALEASLGTVDLIVTNNRKRMVTAKRNGKRHELRIHRMFVNAPSETIAALVGLARGEGDERDELRRYIRENKSDIDHTPKRTGLRTAGKVHNLADSLERATALLARDGFDDLQITWGRDGKGRRSIRFGSYDFTQRLIRIHPALDDDWIPTMFVDFVVYHELLHVVVPPVEHESGRRDLHPPEFRELESCFPDYDEAMTWQRQNLDRLLNR